MPSLSIVVPARNAADYLPCCLAALAESGTGAQIIVVDDASTDDTGAIATASGATVIRSEENIGAGPARNLGVTHATGEILLFVDADVEANAAAIEGMRQHLETHPEHAAVFGSYDDAPVVSTWVSQYRNLLHHYVHQHGSTRPDHFWAGFGAIRRAAFLAVGGFDEDAYRSGIEDVELGLRLTAADQAICMDPTLQVKHHKAWTLWSMLRTDLLLRSIPWSRLIFENRARSDSFSLDRRARLSAILAVAIAAGLGVLLFKPAITVIGVLVLFGGLFWWVNRDLLRFFRWRRGGLFAIVCGGLHWLYSLTAVLGFAIALAAYGWRPANRGIEQ